MTNDAAKSTTLRHVANCLYIGESDIATPDGATLVLIRGGWCEETCYENGRMSNENMVEAVVRFSRKKG